MGKQENYSRETPGRLRWSLIRGLGKNRIVRSSYVWMVGVPIAARLVHALKERVVEGGWARQVVESLHLPFAWQLLFWASVLWAVATVLFDLRCPGIIRDYADWGEFEAAGRDDKHLLRLAEQVAEDKETVRGSNTTPDPVVRRLGRSACIDYHPYTATFFEFKWIYFEEGNLRLGNDLETRNAFWHVWSAAESKRRCAMVASLVAYIVGGVLVVLVFVQNIAWVLREAM